MADRSYVESIKPRIARRDSLVTAAILEMYKILRTHTVFDGEGAWGGDPLVQR